MIEIENLSYCYEDGRTALDAINLKVATGEKVALVGPNGAGKTTLLLQLNGILCGSGVVRIDHQELSEKNIKQIRGKVGLAFQAPDNQLFSKSVYDDVAYGLVYQGVPAGLIKDKVAVTLEMVGMPDCEERSPYHLSLGEKKRIALATVLVMRPCVLALDEPTAGLDPRGRRGIINLLAGLDQTLVIATHDMTMVKELCPRMVVMDGGRIVFDGSTMVAFQNPDLLEKHGLTDY
jgi:cobalt/nickel transport system ATP-binding protein